MRIYYWKIKSARDSPASHNHKIIYQYNWITILRNSTLECLCYSV
jgi:hypothetical protein